MKVLDLDLDFFMNHIAGDRNTDGSRLRDRYYRPWHVEDVRKFIENKCKLSRKKPIRGKCFEHHHEAFYCWRELIKQNRLVAPFILTHIDAHSDLGLGEPACGYIMTELLCVDVVDRCNEIKIDKELSQGNFIAFAVACRWVSKIEFVMHNEWVNDLAQHHFKNFDITSDPLELQLKQCTGGQFSKLIYSGMDKKLLSTEKLVYEPVVPFIKIPAAKYVNDSPFDFVFLTKSPEFTTKSADVLFDTIKVYIEEF